MKNEFIISIEGVNVRVTHESHWLNSGYDHFEFSDLHEPRKPIPISHTGYRSQFAHREAVEQCGGPEAYANAYAKACMQGEAAIGIPGNDGETADTQPVQLGLFA